MVSLSFCFCFGGDECLVSWRLWFADLVISYAGLPTRSRRSTGNRIMMSRRSRAVRCWLITGQRRSEQGSLAGVGEVWPKGESQMMRCSSQGLRSNVSDGPLVLVIPYRHDFLIPSRK